MNPDVSANTRPKQDDAISLLCDSELDIFRKSLFRCQGRECTSWRGATCQHCLFITRPGVPLRLYCVCDWQVGGAVLSGACHLCCRFWQLIGIVVIVKVMCENEAVKDGRDDSSEKKGIPAILCLWVCVRERSLGLYDRRCCSSLCWVFGHVFSFSRAKKKKKHRWHIFRIRPWPPSTFLSVSSSFPALSRFFKLQLCKNNLFPFTLICPPSQSSTWLVKDFYHCVDEISGEGCATDPFSPSPLLLLLLLPSDWTHTWTWHPGLDCIVILD